MGLREKVFNAIWLSKWVDFGPGGAARTDVDPTKLTDRIMAIVEQHYAVQGGQS